MRSSTEYSSIKTSTRTTSVYKLNKLLSVRGSLLSCSVILLLTNCTSCTMFSVPNNDDDDDDDDICIDQISQFNVPDEI